MNKKERGLLEEKFSKWADEAKTKRDILWTLEKVRTDFNSVVSSSNGYQSKALVDWQGEVLDRIGLGSTEQVIESVVADAVEAVQEVFESFPKDTVTYSIGESVVENILSKVELADVSESAVPAVYAGKHKIINSNTVSSTFLSRAHSKLFAGVGIGVLALGVGVVGVGGGGTSAAYASTYLDNGQTFSVTSSVASPATRDGVSVSAAPAVAGTVVRPVSVDVSGIGGNSALVGSALKYLGSHWDCTMLVEQALRDLGYEVPDLGPMGFGAYGTVFYDPSLVQAGDIMMRGGHVAIYAGNGLTVQGGFGFGGVVLNSWEGPSSYSAFVRVG